MTANEQALDEFEARGLVLSSVAVDCGTHDVVKFTTNVFEGFTQLGHEAVARWEVVHGDGHDHADRGEDDTVGISASFIAGPSIQEGGLVDVAIDPIAVFKVIGDEAVYRIEGGKESKKISVIFVCGHDIVEGCVMARLAVAVVRLSRVLEGVSGGNGRRGREVPE